jgi:proton glutamate symport protein
VVYAMFMRILGWLLVFMPFGLLCLAARSVLELRQGPADLTALLKFIVVFATTASSLMAVALALIALLLRTSLAKALTLVRTPILLAFWSASSASAVPLVLERVSRQPQLNGLLARTLVPLGVSFHPFGSVMYFGMGAMFIAQLQSVQLSPVAYGLLILGAIVSGMTAGGLPGPGSIVVLGLVLAPLGIPPEAGMTALFIVNPVVDPFITALNVQGNFVATALLARRSVAGNEDLGLESTTVTPQMAPGTLV